ncbi:bacillithiol biosynthesis cysteine-adding enzyme BshC [Cytobacillus horneckiae]|uniref:Putative cysteine ligase BshC n=1 Tax=Cytobacillus horneckiae TaxID=549687 RepID=A0A2N0ZBH6_9BACI|nr:bacillithiol biosynthesis cysteine-adding enzyme BshC [Cytobacillus horneckiae]MCM3178358.1 bacillithiol biosynthesis cysteine-adding enzyme BshC [Cytobacillus horneckiae]MEC1156902.1 bacillithiol biosynthesis cysteine-adding enzyme BshC [Cytobacillus horneckiae]MED2940072.1 bacillithiol biosynthesis cysteine-adding enzyme BshC [Cytobacillus horneckiae]PKG26835.1 bacillithiol biosynthesis cysteine-adding enzyme BshC [Cytobacillus horneckiae]
MEILNLSLPATNRFATEYIAQTEDIQRFFHYRYNHAADFQSRLMELRHRSYMREDLTAYIKQFMAKFPTSTEVEESLEKLKRDDSVVVIGGQQAGIMTGPLYSIHKVISIISLAKQKEKELNIPVVPIFWIAGEDHDYQEVNHVYVRKNNRMEKMVYPEKVYEKKMVSNIEINHEICLKWAESIVEAFGETKFTNELLEFIHEAINRSNTYVDFFGYIMMRLFKDDGLLLVDSGDKNFRKLEKEILKKQINASVEITKSVLEAQENLSDNGFSKMIEIGEHAANLFYYDEVHKERMLLDYHEETKTFTDKDGHLSFKVAELLTIAENEPEKLSNNVVTRPLTQEWLFPTLAFIAGPGEIAYWAELKEVFNRFSMKMPPLVPRLNFTIVERAVDSDMSELGLDLTSTLIHGTEEKKQMFLNSIRNSERDEIFNRMREKLEAEYQLLEANTVKEDKGLLPLLEKNKAILFNHIQFMSEKFDQTAQQKHETIISKFTRIESSLKPNGSPQERVWNGLYYLNLYGMEFYSQLLEHSWSFDGTHKVIKI